MPESAENSVDVTQVSDGTVVIEQSQASRGSLRQIVHRVLRVTCRVRIIITPNRFP